MTPEEFELLSAYLDNALTRRQREVLEARLAASAELRAQLAELRAMRAVLRSAPMLKPPRDFRLDPTRFARTAWWSRLDVLRFSSALSAAAAIVLIALGIALSSASRAPIGSIAMQATASSTPTSAPRLALPTAPVAAPPLAQPTQAPDAATAAVMAPLAFTATPDMIAEAGLMMAPEESPEAPQEAEKLIATQAPTPQAASAELSQTALSPVARLAILLGILLLIIGGVLFLIATFKVRT